MLNRKVQTGRNKEREKRKENVINNIKSTS